MVKKKQDKRSVLTISMRLDEKVFAASGLLRAKCRDKILPCTNTKVRKYNILEEDSAHQILSFLNLPRAFLGGRQLSSVFSADVAFTSYKMEEVKASAKTPYRNDFFVWLVDDHGLVISQFSAG